ncbi:MAG TPA: NYN domain-containing protein [Candidatus Handelsmanbacteria bacterium]|nr:NYN domain-containing protein [Candidatus Handelsmanbacteria bacterium]
MDRVAVFADVQNLYYTVNEQHNCHFDYGAFLRQVTEGRQLIKALAYATDKGDERQRRFQQILKGLGFEVKLQPFIQRSDGSTKGDWDVGITVDMLEHAPRVDTIVLASGDGDYAAVVTKLVNELDIAVEVYGAQDLTAGLLARAATRFVPIQGRLLLPIPTSW